MFSAVADTDNNATVLTKVLIVTYRREDLLKRCVGQLCRHFELSDLLVVDNQSAESDAIADYCEATGVAILRNTANDGFAKAVNRGMRCLIDDGADWVLLINTDADLLADPKGLVQSPDPGWACITTFDGAAQRPWDCEKPIPNPWRAAWEDAGFGRFRLPQPLGSRYRSFSDRHKGYLVGCFLLISAAAWKHIGEFDERFWLYSEETDWCLRAYGAEMECKVIPVVGYRHEARQSSSGSAEASRKSTDAYWNSRLLFLEKHWGSKGMHAYKILFRSLTALRKFAGILRQS